jgi:hypothetical protein
VANSPEFRRAPRLRELFLHICQTSLAGHDDRLTEQQIGRRVFGRDEDWNSAEDSIVRAQVRLLRRKLESWFQEEGKTERMVITIPRGSYVPSWTERELAPEPLPDTAPPAAVEPVAPVAIPARAPARQPRHIALVVVAVAAAFLLGWLMARPAAEHGSRHPLLANFFDGSRPVLLVVQDASLILVNNALRTTIPLADFQSGSYKSRLTDPALPDDLQRLLRIIDSRQYTSLGDLAIQRQLFEHFPQARSRVQVVSPRHLHLRQLKASNAIIVGGATANPWLDLFDDALEFRLVPRTPSGGLAIANLHPRPGEPNRYEPDERTAWGVLASLPGGDSGGSVILVAGTSLEATEAAAETVIVPERAQRLASMLQGRDTTRFQAIVRCRRFEGTSTASEIVALRTP